MSVVELGESLSLAGMLPGPVLAGVLSDLPPGGVDEFELVEVMRAARRLTAWAESLELAAIAELDRRRQVGAGRRGVWTVEMDRALCDEISAALTLSGTAAAIRLGVAGKLADLLPGTRQALAEGRIDVAKARVICDGVLGVRDEIARGVEQLVLPDAPRLTARQLAVRVRKAITEADPQAYDERRKASEKGRRLELYDNPDGTMDLAARDLPAESADAAYNYVNALAAALKTDGDQRPIDAIRADVALDLLRGHRPAELSPTPADPDEPTPTTAQPEATPDGATTPTTPTGHVQDDRQTPISTGNTSATSRSSEISPDNRSANTPEIGPAVGSEPGPASGSDDADSGRREAVAVTKMARAQLAELLEQVRELNRLDEHRLLVTEATRRITEAIAPLKARWCTITADTDGGGVVHGHDGYRPPAAMRRLVQTRTSTCAFPTCRRHATRCDLDHTVPYHQDGPTCPCNLAPLCRGHHRLKQHPDWTLNQLWPGVLLWTAPTGHWYLVGPEP